MTHSRRGLVALLLVACGGTVVDPLPADPTPAPEAGETPAIEEGPARVPDAGKGDAGPCYECRADGRGWVCGENVPAPYSVSCSLCGSGAGPCADAGSD